MLAATVLVAVLAWFGGRGSAAQVLARSACAVGAGITGARGGATPRTPTAHDARAIAHAVPAEPRDGGLDAIVPSTFALAEQRTECAIAIARPAVAIVQAERERVRARGPPVRAG